MSYLIIGRNPVEEVLLHQPRRIIKAFALKSNKGSDRKSKLLSDLQNKRIPVVFCDKRELDKMCDSTSHQGFALLVKDKSYMPLETFLKTDRQKSLVVVLDSILDPHNVGAILRASDAFNVDLVVWSKNRGPSMSPTITKTSSAASEFVDISFVANLANAIDKLKQEGYQVVSADVNEVSKSIYEFEFPAKCVIIMGSEQEGVRNLLKKKTDYFVSIPMLGKLDSLNVSQATAVFLSSYQRSHS